MAKATRITGQKMEQK